MLTQAAHWSGLRFYLPLKIRLAIHLATQPGSQLALAKRYQMTYLAKRLISLSYQTHDDRLT
jgi:hypothetical protein